MIKQVKSWVEEKEKILISRSYMSKIRREQGEFKGLRTVSGLGDIFPLGTMGGDKTGKDVWVQFEGLMC